VITLGVGGVVARFESLDSDLSLRVSFPRTRFVLDDDVSSHSVVHARYGDPSPGPVAPWFVSGGTWELHHGELGGDRVVFYTASEGGRDPMYRLDLTADLSRGELAVERRYVRDGVLEIGFPLDEYLMNRLLARRGAAVLHASCMAQNGAALVFTGHSGAGKSTISSIAERCGWKVLSDDRTILTLEDGVVHASGTPWHGSHKCGTADSLPVKGIFLLEQAPEDSAEPMEMSRGFSEVLVRTVRPLADVEEQVAVVNTVERIVRSVPLGVLRFRPQPEALRVAREFVRL
jgi:hypothetical protein